MTEITIEQFNAYRKVQYSGRTNMFDTNMVSALSGLDKNTIMSIMSEYEELEKLYPDTGC